MNKKRAYLIFGVFCLLWAGADYARSQTTRSGYESYLPRLGVKTNALYWMTATPNLGLEIGLGARTTIDVSANYNPWSFSRNRKLKHWLVQPELRLWTCERFSGHFFGIHAFYAGYNAGGIELFGMEDHRYQGDLYGAGFSYGYQWMIGRRWNLEATVGIGYARLKYDRYDCVRCGAYQGKHVKNYYGPTKAGITFIYLIK